MKTYRHSLLPRRARARLLAGSPAAPARHVPAWLRATSLTAAVTASMFAVLAVPASAGTTLVSGVGVFNEACQPPIGGPPGNLGDYPPIDLSGSLEGCWYTYVSADRFNPSGTYIEQGTEFFIGCLNVANVPKCGTFETTYTFTGKYTDETFAEEIFGRCEHSVVGGTGDFAGAKGVILFKDDVVNLKFDYRGQIMLASPNGQNDAAVALNAAKLLDANGPTRSGGC